MMKKALFIWMVFCLFPWIFAAHVPGNRRFSPRAMPPLSWLNAPLRVDLATSAGTVQSEAPRIAVSGDSVYVVWQEERNGSEDIYFNRSLDRGATWGVPVRLDRKPSPCAGWPLSSNPRIAVSGDSIYVVWVDGRNNTNGTDLYFNRSLDRGDTWMADDLRLAGPFSSKPMICARGDRVYVVWEDSGHGVDHNTSSVYFNRSLDRGTSWLAGGINLDKTEYFNSTNPRISVSGDQVYVVWQDDRNGARDVYLNRSGDAGATWRATDMRLDTGDAAGAHDSLNPRICSSGANVYVAWCDQRSAPDGVYFNRSADSGSSWLASAVRVDGGDAVEPPEYRYGCLDARICCSGESVYVTWIGEYRYLTPGPYHKDLFFNQSRDGGITWQAGDTRLNTGVEQYQCFSVGDPAICCTGDDVHVGWREYRNGRLGVYFNHSADGGFAWLPADICLKFDFTNALDMTCTGDNVFAVWQDSRDGAPDIYFTTTEAAPVADAGADGEARVGEAYSLDGRGSSDPDGDSLDFAWVLRARPADSTASLAHRGTSTPSFTPDAAGAYEFGLTVTDPFGESDTDRVTVTATDLVELVLVAGSGGATRPAPGTYTYDRGETVTVTAVPDEGFVFGGWSGDASGAANPLTVLMNRNKRVTARFEALVYPPRNLSGTRIENRSLSMAEYIARLTWQAHPDNIQVTGYRVTRVGGDGEVEVGVTGADTFVFEERGVPAQGPLTYRVYTLRADGCRSDPAEVTIQ